MTASQENEDSSVDTHVSQLLHEMGGVIQSMTSELTHVQRSFSDLSSFATLQKLSLEQMTLWSHLVERHVSQQSLEPFNHLSQITNPCVRCGEISARKSGCWVFPSQASAPASKFSLMRT